MMLKRDSVLCGANFSPDLSKIPAQSAGRISAHIPKYSNIPKNTKIKIQICWCVVLIGGCQPVCFWHGPCQLSSFNHNKRLSFDRVRGANLRVVLVCLFFWVVILCARMVLYAWKRQRSPGSHLPHYMVVEQGNPPKNLDSGLRGFKTHECFLSQPI